MDTHEQTSSTRRGIPAGFLVIIGAVIASVLLAVALAWAMLSSNTTVVTDTTTVVTTPPASTGTVVTPTIPVQPAPEQIDSALVAWHDQQAPDIARVLAALGAAPVETSERMRSRCLQLSKSLELLEKAPAAPRESVAAPFSNWLVEMREAITFCTGDAAELPETEAIATVSSALSATGVAFNTFYLELGRWVDLR